jgi:hypothetical protein
MSRQIRNPWGHKILELLGNGEILKLLLSSIMLLALSGCGSGTSTGTDSLTAAKLVNGNWNISYTIGTRVHDDHFAIRPINIGLPAPNTTDYSFATTTIDVNGIGTFWTVKYSSANDTWTIQGSSDEYVFQTDGTKFLAGACLYETHTDGTPSPCIPLTGVKSTEISASGYLNEQVR